MHSATCWVDIVCFFFFKGDAAASIALYFKYVQNEHKQVKNQMIIGTIKQVPRITVIKLLSVHVTCLPLALFIPYSKRLESMFLPHYQFKTIGHGEH